MDLRRLHGTLKAAAALTIIEIVVLAMIHLGLLERVLSADALRGTWLSLDKVVPLAIVVVWLGAFADLRSKGLDLRGLAALVFKPARWKRGYVDTVWKQGMLRQ